MNRRRVLGLAIPTMGENLLQTTVAATNTVMVGRLGKDELAGVGAAGEIIWFMIATLLALQVGATVLVSQAIGAGDRDRANRLARQAVIWSTIAAVPISLLGYLLADQLMGLFGVEPEVVEHGATYLRITAAAAIFMVLNFVCGAVLRGAGDGRTPFYASIVANLVNVVVSWLLIFGNLGFPEWGVAGSAVGAFTGRLVAAVVLLVLLVSGRRVISLAGRDGWRPNLESGRSLTKLGFPAAVEEMLISAGFILMLRVVAILGTAAIAAQSVAFNALSLSFMPGFAFGITATALVGQSIGAQKPEEGRIAAGIAQRWAIGWMAAGGVIYLVLAEPILSLFTTDADVKHDGVIALQVLAVTIPLWAVWVVSGSALRGTGDTRTPLLTSVVAVYGGVALGWAAVELIDGGLGTIWAIFGITTPLAGLLNWWIFRGRIRDAIREAVPADGVARIEPSPAD